MTRKEYLDSIEKQAEDFSNPNIPDRDHPRFVTLDDYLVARRKCEDYEQRTNISEYLTKEDYEQFDKNFENALGDILYKDEDFENDEIDKTIEMMKAIDWKWTSAGESIDKPATPNHAQFIALIRRCYEDCFREGHAKGGCGTGGVYVETDIMDHFVKITFSSIDACAFDGDDSH